MLYSLAGMKANIPSMWTFLTAHLDSCLRYCAGLPDLHLHAESSSPSPSLFSIINFHLSWIWIIIPHHCYCLQIYNYNYNYIIIIISSYRIISVSQYLVNPAKWYQIKPCQWCHKDEMLWFVMFQITSRFDMQRKRTVSVNLCMLVSVTAPCARTRSSEPFPLMCRGLLMLLLRANSGCYHCLRLPWAIFIILIQKAKAILDTAL